MEQPLTKLDCLREIIEDRIDYCFRALPSRSDSIVNNSKFRELKAMINCYQFVLEKIKEINESKTLDPDIKEKDEKQ